MRQATLDLEALVKEFESLKSELFNGQSFVEPDYSNPKWVRYNELVKRFFGSN